MPLHPDAEAFLEERNAFRDELAAALADPGDTEEPAEDTTDSDTAAVEEDIATVGEQVENQGAADPEAPPKTNELTNEGGVEEATCELSGRDTTRGSTCTSTQQRLAGVTPIESFRDPNGWPNSDQLYQDLLALYDRAGRGNASDTDTMEQAIQWQRQINVLESYRKMLLHKKQRWCHFLSSWCECMKNEAQSQEQFRALMENALVGIEASASSSDDDAGEAADEA